MIFAWWGEIQSFTRERLFFYAVYKKRCKIGIHFFLILLSKTIFLLWKKYWYLFYRLKNAQQPCSISLRRQTYRLFVDRPNPFWPIINWPVLTHYRTRHIYRSPTFKCLIPSVFTFSFSHTWKPFVTLYMRSWLKWPRRYSFFRQ